MISGSLSKRYAGAMFEVSLANNSLEADYGILKALSAAFQADKAAVDYLSDEAVDRGRRRAVLDGVMKSLNPNTDLANFLRLLIDKERIGGLVSIVQVFESMRNQRENRANVEVRSPQPLTEDQRAKLKQTLTSRLGKAIELEESVDPALLGGLWIRVGSVVLDGALNTQLDRLRTLLAKA